MDKAIAINQIRTLLKSSGYSLGSWMQIPNTSIAEIIGSAGYDWVAIDLEHGAISNSQLPDLFRALELGGTLPLVRLAQGDAKNCKLALDAGAGGVIAPMIETANQVEDLINACCWPPSGNRGVGFSRANLFGKNFDSYFDEAQAPLIIAMIESIKAVENLEDIVKVNGLDAILIGPYDLSASIGMTGKFENQEFKDLIVRIKKTAKTSNIACGIHVVEPSKDELELRIEEGYRFIPYSIDSVFLNHALQRPLK
jgi:2-dehydro-3-deoxyglucarate aldolase